MGSCLCHCLEGSALCCCVAHAWDARKCKWDVVGKCGKIYDSFQDMRGRRSTFQTARSQRNPADYVHKHIDAEFWGVSLHQLEEFAKDVREAIVNGTIKNDSEEQCKQKGGYYYPQESFDDPDKGPNMYIVNEKVIKPRTMQADRIFGISNLSYALMQNSRWGGIRCVLFISHAWLEPLFEFQSSIRSSWPRSLSRNHGAYFCCLSNPQNLDISALIARPETSPFYRVLVGEAQPHVVMLANSVTPIHKRLWCVYEAFVAQERGLPVTIGGRKDNLVMHREAAERAEDASRIAQQLQRAHVIEEDDMFQTCANFATCGSQGPDRNCRELYICVSCPCCWSCYALTFCGYQCKKGCKGTHFTQRADQELLVHQARRSALDVREAECFSDADRSNILRNIRGREEDVNSMIHHLIFGDTCGNDNSVI